MAHRTLYCPPRQGQSAHAWPLFETPKQTKFGWRKQVALCEATNTVHSAPGTQTQPCTPLPHPRPLIGSFMAGHYCLQPPGVLVLQSTGSLAPRVHVWRRHAATYRAKSVCKSACGFWRRCQRWWFGGTYANLSYNLTRLLQGVHSCLIQWHGPGAIASNVGDCTQPP